MKGFGKCTAQLHRVVYNLEFSCRSTQSVIGIAVDLKDKLGLNHSRCETD